MNPYAMFDYMSAILFAQWFCPCGQCHQQKVFKTITWLLLSRLRGSKPHRNSPEPSEPCYTSTPELTGTLPELASRTYASMRRNFWNPPESSGTCPSGTCFRNLHQHAPELSGTFRNLPPEPTPAHRGTLRNLPEPSSGTYTRRRRNSPEPSGTGTFRNLPPAPAHTGTLRNLTSTPRNFPEPSGTCLQNIHQHAPELSTTFRNLPPEPTPAHTRTLRNLPEPSSGACSCNPHRHTPELIWAENPLAYAVGEKTD